MPYDMRIPLTATSLLPLNSSAPSLRGRRGDSELPRPIILRPFGDVKGPMTLEFTLWDPSSLARKARKARKIIFSVKNRWPGFQRIDGEYHQAGRYHLFVVIGHHEAVCDRSFYLFQGCLGGDLQSRVASDLTASMEEVGACLEHVESFLLRLRTRAFDGEDTPLLEPMDLEGRSSTDILREHVCAIT